jgi:hypothetical protein
MARCSYKRALVALATLSAAPAGLASAGPFQDQLVQAPSIGTPQRGSLAGTLSKLAIGPGDLARGAFALPLPIDLPTDRGPLLAKIAPSYSPETGITEWGMGWQAELKIQRFQPVGEVDFATDQFTGPWGRLVPGDDGAYYPVGLASVVRVTAENGGWIAQSSDGTRYRFDAADSVTTPQGTFAWMLSRVDTILGDSTTLTWTRNASGRPFLDTVRCTRRSHHWCRTPPAPGSSSISESRSSRCASGRAVATRFAATTTSCTARARRGEPTISSASPGPTRPAPSTRR